MMLQLNEYLFFAMGIYWIASSRKVNKTRMQESQLSRWLHLAPTGLAFFLLFNDVFENTFLAHVLLTPSLTTGILGNLLTVLSLAFAIWARLHLGRNWSAVVTLKEGHQLIRTGPYSFVRHPIYTGLIFGIFGTVIIQGKVFGILVLFMIVAVYYRKIRLEETVLTQAFGDEYRRYQKEVKALIPYVL